HEKAEIKDEIRKYTKASVYFSIIKYSDVIFGQSEMPLKNLHGTNVTLITGIAKPEPLIKYLEERFINFKHIKYADHHNFTSSEVKELDKLECILTTEKDYVRLKPLLKAAKIYYLPIKIGFLDQKIEFNNQILDYVNETIKA
ncbi:MAG: tetraacyldisaccharide 4'-kinase, partial [Leeuwenhoekiella sp.]